MCKSITSTGGALGKDTYTIVPMESLVESSARPIVPVGMRVEHMPGLQV